MRVGFSENNVGMVGKKVPFSFVIPINETDVDYEDYTVKNIKWHHLCNKFVIAYYSVARHLGISAPAYHHNYNIDCVIQKKFENMVKIIQLEHNRGEKGVVLRFDLTITIKSIMKPE